MVNANVELLCPHHRWWLELGLKDCTVAVAQRQRSTCSVWGMVLGTVRLELLHWWGKMEARNKGFPPTPQRQWEALEEFMPGWTLVCRKWNLKAGDVCLHSMLLLLLKLLTPLSKLWILAPWGMGLISSDNTATWIQRAFPKSQRAPQVYHYFQKGLQGVIPWD